jgi:DNA-binding CsgD family transcriptional regulator/PAS domain-containing protein
MSTHDFGRVIDRIYQSALDRHQWRTVLQEIADLLAANSAALFPGAGDLRVAAWSEGTDALADWMIRTGDHIPNPRVPRALALSRTRQILTEADVCTREELRRHPFNVGMIDHLGYRWEAGTVLTWISGAPVIFAVHRRGDQEYFDRAALSVFGTLLPHVKRAVEINVELDDRATLGQLEAFETMGSGAIAINSVGRVAFLNRAADRLVGDVVRIHQKGLSAIDRDADRGLQRLIGATLAGGEASHTQCSRAVRLPRVDMAPVIAIGVPINGAKRDLFKNVKMLLVLVDPSMRKSEAAEDLRAAFNLTPAEAHLAVALARGSSVEDYARHAGIAVPTARTQLKSVMAKTDTHRQGELVALIARLV